LVPDATRRQLDLNVLRQFLDRNHSVRRPFFQHLRPIARARWTERLEATHAWLDLSRRLDRRGHGCAFVAGFALNSANERRNKSEESAVTDTSASPLAEGTTLNLQWGPIIAGAVAAAALALVLHTFAGAIGLAVSSAAPTWRDASTALVLLSGLYLLLAALASYGFGGYIAARVRSRAVPATAEAVEWRDGMHGLLAWALATLLAGLIAFASLQSLPRLAAPSGASAGPSTSVAGENVIAYDLDRLFRSERRQEGDISYARAEAGRILLTASSHSGLQPDDRTYLARLVAARTGLAQADAERRVDEVVVRARDSIARARRTAVILAFMAGASALLGAVAAWFAATTGGEHRDGRIAPHMLWNWSSPARRV
jgi:hypothetical protein